MPIRFILKQLFMPPGLLLLLLLLGFVLRRRFPRFSMLCFLSGFLGLLVMSLPVTVDWGARQLEPQQALRQAQWPGWRSVPTPLWCWAPGGYAATAPGTKTSPA